MLAFAAACGSDSGPSTSIDLNAALNATANGDLGTLPGASTIFGMPNTPLRSAVDASQCVFTASSQTFVCPPASGNGLTFKGSYQLFDAAGQPQSSLNQATTSSVRAIFDVDGSTPVPELHGTAAIHHHSDLRLSGLLTTTRLLNGSSTDKDTITSVTGSVTTRTAITGSSTTANVGLPSGSSKYPSGGTITADIATVTFVGSLQTVATNTHAVLTFNGTNLATLVITIGGSTRTCQIDLDGGSPRCSGA